MNTNNVDVDQLASVFENEKIVGKYLSYKKMFEFKVLDFYGYVRDRSCPYFYYVKISEPNLLRMLRFDNYPEDEKNELYYHRLLEVYEQGKGDKDTLGVDIEPLDDDIYWGISILQYFFHISKRTIADMKVAAHMFKLHKRESKNVELKKWQLHSKGGRPIGSLSGLSEADLQNLENVDAIIRTCVEKDRFVEYMELSRLLVRMRTRTETGELLTITGAKWKFYILRYKWKLSCGYKERDKEYEKKLVEKNKEYGIFRKLEF